MNLNWFDKDELFPKVIEQLQKVDIVLDIGCGIRPQNYICPLVHICCEPFEEYSEILIDKANQQTDRRFIVLKAGWEEAVKLFAPKSVDTIFLLDVIEHLDKEKGEELLRLTESIARKQVVIFTPLGYVPQEHPDGIDAWGLNGGAWQEHKSGWLPDDFDDSWDIYACKEFHFIDHNGNPFDKPYGAFWAIKTFDHEKTKVLFLIQSYIPKVKHDEYFFIFKNTINSIKQQKIDDSLQVNIVITDDGSDYLKDFIDNNVDINFLSKESLDIIKSKYDLDIDEIVSTSESNYFRKADLFNFYLKQKGSKYDLIIFLDDDHNFIRNDSLEKFIKHYNTGYNFIIGNLYYPIHHLYDIDSTCQGTTYAMSYDALKRINFFNEKVKEWGFGEDADIFYKSYLATQKNIIKAIFDTNIITVDNISSRWSNCIKTAGGIEEGIKKFEQYHNVDYHNCIPSKKLWMDIIYNEYGFRKSIIRSMTLNDYLKYQHSSNNQKFIIRAKLWLFYLPKLFFLYPVRKIISTLSKLKKYILTEVFIAKK